nr:hypothetical protein [Burkholderia guangdongensis]
MIAGGLVVVAAGASYLLLLNADHRVMAEAGMADSTRNQAADAQMSDGHTSQGNVEQPTLSSAPAKSADAVQQPAPTSVVVTPAPAPGPVAVPAAPSAGAQPQLAVQPSEPATSAVASVDAQHAPVSATHPAQHTPRRRETLARHATTNQTATNQAMTPETAALVGASSKLDPSLPPPSLPVRSSTGQRGSSSGSNPVAAAMTDQLVRSSSHLDPSLPASGSNPATSK